MVSDVINSDALETCFLHISSHVANEARETSTWAVFAVVTALCLVTFCDTVGESDVRLMWKQGITQSLQFIITYVMYGIMNQYI